LVDDMIAKDLVVSLAMPATWYRVRADEMEEARTHPQHLWEKRYETIRRMHEAGVKLVISSDQGSTSTRIDELALLMDFLVNKVYLPPMHVLYGVTGLAAEALGIEADVGTLAPGKLADLILVDGDPSIDMAALRRIHMVVKEGTVAVRDGVLV